MTLLDAATPSITVFGPGSSSSFREVLTIAIAAVLLYGLRTFHPVIQSWVRPPTPPTPPVILTAVQIQELLKTLGEQVHRSTRTIVDEELATLRQVTANIHSVLAKLEQNDTAEGLLLNTISRDIAIVLVRLEGIQRAVDLEHTRP